MPETDARTCQSLKARIVLPEDLQRRRLVQVLLPPYGFIRCEAPAITFFIFDPPWVIRRRGLTTDPFCLFQLTPPRVITLPSHVLPDSCYNRYAVTGTSNPSTAILGPTARGALLHVRLQHLTTDDHGTILPFAHRHSCGLALWDSSPLGTQPLRAFLALCRIIKRAPLMFSS